jgi:predicted nucleic acid-binding OB-fold protein
MSLFLNFLKTITPILIQELFKAASLNVGGFRLWIVKKILQYGGKQFVEYLNEAIRVHERDVAQKEAQEKLDQVVKNPNATAEEKGKAYEEYFNTRGPSTNSSHSVQKLP